MVLVGGVLDEDGRPVRWSLIEVWQANASGKYPHPVDDHEAPLDPNFLGKGQGSSSQTTRAAIGW
jgi:protocatechuate 3,4-dioxygenase beta subunit